jgi:hypothetical protein
VRGGMTRASGALFQADQEKARTDGLGMNDPSVYVPLVPEF